MPVTNYYTVNGEIVGESAGGVRTDYMVDALGSVTGTVNQSAQVLNTYRYKPYGALLAKTGTASDPKMLWGGTLGYRATGRRQSDVYVKARHYSADVGCWTALDPLWPRDWPYACVRGNPPSFSDPNGRQTIHLPPPPLRPHPSCDEWKTFECGASSITCGDGVTVWIPYTCEISYIASYNDPYDPLAPDPDAQSPCHISGSFRGHPLPTNYWNCLEDGVKANCSDSPYDSKVLLTVLRCIAFAENNDQMYGRSDEADPPPYGPMSIGDNKRLGARSRKCDRVYPKWKTDPCDNLKCGALLLCDCLRRSKTWGIGSCGHLGGEEGGPEDFNVFDVIDNPDSTKFCDCLKGYGFSESSRPRLR